MVHDVFNTTDDIKAAVSERLMEAKIVSRDFTWIGGNKPLEFTDDPEVAVVLDITLGTLEETINFVRSWFMNVHHNCWYFGWLDHLKTDAKNMRLLTGSEPFQPFTMRWRRIKLDRYKAGTVPQHVRDPAKSPGVAALLVSVQHPARITSIDYKTRFGWWAPGLECTAPDDVKWQHSPYVRWFRDNPPHNPSQAIFEARWSGRGCCFLAVPVLVE